MLDRPVAGGPAGGTEERRKGRDHDRATVAQKGDSCSHLSKHWKAPPEGDAAFVAAMEAVPVVHNLPADPYSPVVWTEGRASSGSGRSFPRSRPIRPRPDPRPWIRPRWRGHARCRDEAPGWPPPCRGDRTPDLGGPGSLHQGHPRRALSRCGPGAPGDGQHHHPQDRSTATTTGLRPAYRRHRRHAPKTTKASPAAAA